MKRFAALSLLLAPVCFALTLGCRADAPPTPLRDDFRKLVIANRKPCPLNPQRVSQTDVGKLTVERVKFTPEEGQDAVAVIYRPKAEGKYPTVILQHYLGGNKDTIAFLPLFNMLTQKGFLVVAIDGRYRGDRQNGKSLEVAMAESLKSGKGHPFLLDTTYDITRLLDYLQTRPDVDAQRIGMTGFSEGGIITWMSAVIDDRIRVAVPIIGVTCFNEAITSQEGLPGGAGVKLLEPALKEYASVLGEKEVNSKVLRAAWQKLVPGMLDRFDAPNTLSLIAPRPLLVLNHENDELFPIGGARKAAAATKLRYAELKMDDHFDFRVAAGLTHSKFDFSEVNGMIDWMDKWLKAAPTMASAK